jgi:GNAT superfamily N-acetyltransferase
LQLNIRRLTKDHDRAAFDCGDPELNKYLRLFAGQNQFKHLVGTTYAAIERDQPFVILGYYTLAATSIPLYSLVEFPNLRKLPYKDVPAVLLARLAVSRQFQTQGIGYRLLGDGIKRALELTQTIGCRCLIVDAYPNAVSWYSKFGIMPLGGGPADSPTCRMLLDLRTAAIAVERATPFGSGSTPG